MNDETSLRNFPHQMASNTPYTKRGPERLVLEGYRHLTAALETQSLAPWELGYALYQSELGPADAKRAFSELSDFVRTLKTCARCPLRTFPYHSDFLCREECLSLGLIASLQHGDDTAILCLQHLACPLREGRIEAAAKSFAMVLASIDQRLLPVPASVIGDILKRDDSHQLH